MENLYNIWKMDSVSGPVASQAVRMEAEMSGMRLAFDKNSFYFCVPHEVFLSDTFKVIQSGKDVWLMPAFVSCKIDLLTNDQLALTLNTELVMKAKMKIYFSPAGKNDMDSFITASLTDRWKENRSWNAMDEKLSKKDRLKFTLNADGSMSSSKASDKDSGTWSIDTKSMILSLKGQKKTQQYKLVMLDRHDMQLNDLSGNQGRMAFRTNLYEDTFEGDTAYAGAYTDSTTTTTTITTDSTAAQSPSQIETMALMQSWKAVSVYTDHDYDQDSVSSNIRITFLKDNTFTLIKGKKKYKGTWRSLSAGSTYALALRIKGKEQVCAYSVYPMFDYEYSPATQP
jgi:hypothetical protein